MIKLTDRLYVAADQVAEVKVPERGDGVHVKTKLGETHWVPSDYGKSEWETCRRLVAEIERQQAGGTT